MSRWLYTIRKRFTNSSTGWKSFIEFSGFGHIVELVTLDSWMCPEMVGDLREEDWAHNVHENLKISFFHEPDYLFGRDGFDKISQHVLGIIHAPQRLEPAGHNFEICGFDIMDSHFGNSTLTNCGQIREGFMPTDVKQYGLVPNIDDAYAIRDRMRALRPDDVHLGKCEVWLISKQK